MARTGLRWWFGVSSFALGLLAAVVMVTVIIFMYLRGQSDKQMQADETPTVYLRDDFASSIFGKSEDQVLEAIGRPDGTSEDAQASYWHYRRRTRNPATGETDSDAQVVFERGRVIAINY